MSWLSEAVKAVEEAVSGLGESVTDGVQNMADDLAAQYQSNHGGGDYDDCVMIVAAGCAAGGAVIGGGPIGAAIGAAGGVPAARIACRRIFPE
jgi:hypothetical protein